ncbi:MAG: oligopeptide transporter, OPT family [Gemmatimonadota bacterium]|nr:oligopeptide transporter, OPT family [Gemmatimonadota bacterium]MDH3478392.1 oligopeptide transporter, OPT family [Gemmatimonadota bacterium]MDH3570073.1 oligopeptide transporter, OPT family [Gemmatimonadota bacterium]MDH5548940.1 oligopeptide transporter, OPT family [Gemmatimonadota bacterium]
MDRKPFVPFVSASETMPEMTFKAIFLGAIMAVALGAANAYVGMRAGLTVAATFPAAVVAMAVLRGFRGTILEENIARTTASVGEALVAGAIFTIPAFVISGAWDELRYLESTAIMLIGGTLGVLFVIVLRRTLVVEADLPFPEAVAAAEIVKAGQGGQTGAKYLFGSLGLAAFWELLKNPNGIPFVQDAASRFYAFKASTVELFQTRVEYSGGLLLNSPHASPMLMGVGYIVGTRISAILFSGAVTGWLLLVPLALFLNPALPDILSSGQSMSDLSNQIWLRQIRPLAVGAMIVAAFYTLYNLRSSLITGIGKAIRQFNLSVPGAEADRTDVDLNLKKVLVAVGFVAIATFFLYLHFAQAVTGALVLTASMVILGFLFAAVAGYLVALIGSSNNPISGLTLTALLIAAVLMVFLGVTDVHGVAGVLGVAGVVCCAAGVAGDMMQDLKVGHILGGTPWKMQVGEIIGVIFAAFVLALPLMALDRVYEIGSAELPAPQAGLMALMANGIVAGDMAWPLVIVGMFFALALILIKAPAPMLVAVGMYLPFQATAAIFVGGLIKLVFELRLKRQGATDQERQRAENLGVLISSGFIAGESLMAVALALLVIGGDFVPWLLGFQRLIGGAEPSFLLSLIAYPVVLFLLAWFTISKMREGSLPAMKVGE